MASGTGRREVPDSEDEPMTSSPVNTSDVAADKLFAAARVPLQDAQDALPEAKDTHQATANSIANVPGKGCASLDADRNDASTDVDASKDVPNKVKSSTTSSQRQSTEAGNIADPQLLGIASPPEGRFEHIDTQHTAANMPASSGGQCEAERDLTHEPHSTTTSETAVTPSVPNVDLPREQMSDQTPSDTAPREVAPEQVIRQSSSEATNDAEQMAGSADEQPRVNASEEVVDSTVDQSGDSLAQAGSLDDALDVKHSTGPQDARGSIEAATIDLNATTQDRTGDEAPENDSASKSADYGTTSIDPSAADSTSNQYIDVDKEICAEPNSNGNSHDRAPANHSVCVGEQQNPAQAGLLQPKTREGPIALPEATLAQARGTETGCSEHAVKTESFDTDMDVDASPATAVIETQTTMADEASSSTQITDDPTNTPAAVNSAIPMDISNTTATTDSQQSEPTADSPAPSPPPAPKTPQEITLAELKAQKTAMLAALAALPAIQVLMEEHARATNVSEDDDDEPTEADIMLAAHKIVKDHIKLLHEYNELKDVGQGLMGLIADQRGVRIVEVNEEFGIGEGD